ncbi:MAG: polysaccharide export protein [Leptolyngbya sp. SIO1D8]|nr:polysaccharide export protein [Leptolyngbya sp. SIO1D8]
MSTSVLMLCVSSGTVIAQITNSDRSLTETNEPFLPTEPSAVLPVQVTTDISSYILGPGDQIAISVIDFPEFEQTRVVLPDGTVLLPLVGSVLASGKTLATLQIEITNRLSVYLVDPIVELNLSVLRPVVVTVGGEVYRPGPVQLNSLTTVSTRVGANSQLNSAATAPTLSAALINAGGVRRTADLRRITVQRQLPNGRQENRTINLWESIFQAAEGNNILLQDGDVIFVPTANEDAEIDPQLVARSSLAPTSVNVRVIGEVRRPGEVQISPDSTVLTAMAVAGGHNSDANLRDVALLRLENTGQVASQTLDLRNLDDMTPIQDGDIIVVPKKGYLDVLDGIARTLQPITAPLNLLLQLNGVFSN